MSGTGGCSKGRNALDTNIADCLLKIWTDSEEVADCDAGNDNTEYLANYTGLFGRGGIHDFEFVGVQGGLGTA